MFEEIECNIKNKIIGKKNYLSIDIIFWLDMIINLNFVNQLKELVNYNLISEKNVFSNEKMIVLCFFWKWYRFIISLDIKNKSLNLLNSITIENIKWDLSNHILEYP